MTDLILHAIAQGGYLGIFLLMALENIFPPIPSEVIMGLGGIAVARGDMALVPLVVAGTAGTTAGNYFWYWIGRYLGYERFRPFVERHGRFLPAFRTMVSLPAGMTRMPVVRFLVWTFAGAAIWNTVLAEAGVLLGTHFADLHRYVGPATVAVFAVLAVGYVWRVLTWKPAGGSR